jgi:hypothetical protein
MYALAGATNDTDFTAEKWGWSDLSKSSIERVRNGWIINLPKPEHINE